MLKLYDFLRDLSHGELSNLSMAGDGNGSITLATQPKVALYVNDGLLRLYSKFVLKESDLYLNLLHTFTHYHLIERFAENYTPIDENDDEPVRYIKDLPGERFTGDLLKILKVFDSSGHEMPLNDVNNTYSLFTPQFNTLQVLDPVTDSVLSVHYQCKHAKIVGESAEILDIPEVLESALRSFVAYRVFSDMNTKDSTGKSIEHFTMYEKLCQNALDGDLVSTSTSSLNTRFSQRGWV